MNAPIDRQPHVQSRFVVPGLADVVNVVCALCGATPNGWWQDGSPKYFGGVVEFEHTTAGSWTAACRCAAGVAARQSHDLTFFDVVRNVKSWSTYPHRIIADLGQPGPPPDHLRAYRAAVAHATSAMQAGDLTSAQYDEQLAELLRDVTPKAPADANQPDLWPMVSDVLCSRELRATYFPEVAVVAGVA